MELRLGQRLNIPITLRVAEVSETVDVTTETHLIAVTQSARATNLRREEIEKLPNGRDFTDVVGLKSILPEHLGNETRRELLRSEVRSAREVVSPNVCRVFDLIEEEGYELVSMEYVDGQTLTQLLQERAPLTLGEARDLASQFLSGLEAIHRAGLVHRDFKPENVMVTRTGRVVVMDLGIAKRAEVKSGTVVGTPAYMAPEQFQGGEVDARADVFAAGVVLAEMTAAPGIGDQKTRDTLREGLRVDPPRVPEGPWSGVIRKAVSREARDRYASARELSRALDSVTQRVEGDEDRHPYPGLAAFTEAEAEHFFGREAEVEVLLRKLGPARLLGIAGPSGAGKSSFVHAGLAPALPEGWRHVVFHPRDRPFASLAQALLPELSGDTEAMSELLRVEEVDAAAAVQDETGAGVADIDVDPDGRRVLVGCKFDRVWVVPVDGGLPRRLTGPTGRIWAGRRLPTGSYRQDRWAWADVGGIKERASRPGEECRVMSSEL